MENKITIRFYEVGKLRPNGPTLKSVLEKIRDLGDQEVREANVSADCRVRLERLEVDGDDIAGEFTRAQTANLPSEVHAQGVRKLSVNGPLGHGIAFRFRTTDHTLAIQYDTRVLSPSRIFSYLLSMQRDAAFEVLPCMNHTAWRRMEQRPLKKLIISIASPSDLADIENAGAAASESFRLLGDAYQTPHIKIEMGMGHRKGALAEGAKDMARQVFDLFRSGDADLRGLRAVTETEPGVPNDEINLIDEILCVRDELDLPDNDPDRSYMIRRDWLKLKMQDHG